MVQYINKSDLVAEIKRRIDEINQLGKKASYEVGLVDAYKIILSFLDILAVKEMDLEKEIENLIEKEKAFVTDDREVKYYNGDSFNHIYELEFIAEHFFELGLSVNNPITATDRGMAEEIIINLKRVEQDYHIDLTKEMEWLRSKTQKGK